MKKATKILLRIGGALIGLFLLFYLVVGPIMKSNTKKHSPEQNISFSQGDVELNAFYCSPSKKGRVIFGDLVPYGEVWRTGANEASTITTNKDLSIDGKILSAGTYSLWTIPGEKSWEVIFNSKMYGWGVKLTDQKPSRDPENDVLTTTASVTKSLTSAENFNIGFKEASPTTIVMLISWDQVVVPVKMEIK